MIMALLAASAALFANNLRADYAKNWTFDGYISCERDQRTVWSEKEEMIAILADEYAIWRSVWFKTKVLNQR